MIRRIDLRGESSPDYRAVVPRADFDVEAALDVVRPICDAVRHRGVEAITEFTARFDKVEQTDIAVPVAALTDALSALDPDIRAALEESIRRLRTTCEAELEQDVTTQVVPGGTVSQMMVPIQRVGLYVPGGIAPLVSSVVMNVVPAQVAGVESIALTSSPRADNGGLPHPTILAACALLGIDEVYAVGGAQAVAMFAYGAGPCAKVDLVTGPGAIYTVAAKRLLKGVAASTICAWLLAPIRSGMGARLRRGSTAGASGAEGSTGSTPDPDVTVTLRTSPWAHGLRRTTCQYQRPGAREPGSTKVWSAGSPAAGAPVTSTTLPETGVQLSSTPAVRARRTVRAPSPRALKSGKASASIVTPSAGVSGTGGAFCAVAVGRAGSRRGRPRARGCAWTGAWAARTVSGGGGALGG